jgi:hypothetical protein
LVPGVAIASHQFNDVPDSYVFHTSIDWLADNAITVGCNPPANTNFCPNRGVTRGEMATFLKRFHDRFITAGGAPIGLGIAGRANGATPHTGNGVIAGMSLNLDIPVSGVLLLSASADAINSVDIDLFACGINTGGSPSLAQDDSWRHVDLSASIAGTCATQTAVQVTPGAMAARLVMSDSVGTTEILGGNLTAVLYPDTEFFGLLDSPSQQVPASPLADVRK